MFLFTEAPSWSSAKSCKRKLHSYSLVLLLLRNPLLHWSRAKPLSQRHFFHQIFRGGAERAKKAAHPQPTVPPTVLYAKLGTLTELRTAAKQQCNILPAGKPLACPDKWSQTCLKLKTRLWKMLLSGNPRELLSTEGKLPSSCRHRRVPKMGSRNHNFASLTGTQEFPPCLVLLIVSTMPRWGRVRQRLGAWILSDNQEIAVPAPWDQQAFDSFSTEAFY